MHYLALLFTGALSSSYNLLSHLRVGVALRASVESLYERLNTEVCERKIPLHFPFFIEHRTNRIAKCFDQRQRFIIAALFISEIYPHACCWKWAFSRAMSHNTFFRQTLWSGEWTQGLGPRSNFPWPFVASFLCWLSHLGRGKFDKITTFADIARENAHFQQHAWGYISEQLQNTRPLTPFLNILLP